jgi:hypothetical protein
MSEEFTFEVRRQDDVVHMTISGPMMVEDALVAITAFEGALPPGEFEFHAHLREMTKYDKPAREAWTQCLLVLKPRIRRVVIYGARPLIRMAAATIVAVIVRIPIDFQD